MPRENYFLVLQIVSGLNQETRFWIQESQQSTNARKQADDVCITPHMQNVPKKIAPRRESNIFHRQGPPFSRFQTQKDRILGIL